MPERKERMPMRDDAEAQPESGYADGKLPTAPSVEQGSEKHDSQVGSEAEFDSDRLAPSRETGRKE